ncbi:DDE-type integrase/transposase/recombinase [Streptococcus canis]|uniref:DDE-type integrase/transposase/recombinase n=1 Tax=Streptococcus canis TaxID=1329 RepID=UPI0035307878
MGDLTYIPTTVGTLYLSVFIDVYSKKIVGWAMGRHMQASVGNGCFQTSLSWRKTQRRTHRPYKPRFLIYWGTILGPA